MLTTVAIEKAIEMNEGVANEPAKQTAMTKQKIEAMGQAMLNEYGLSDWRLRLVCEEDDMGDEDDIAGSYGRAYYEEKLIWVNMRYAVYPRLVREILLHEITHALLGKREGDPHDEEFRRKLHEIGGGVFCPLAFAPMTEEQPPAVSGPGLE